MSEKHTKRASARKRGYDPAMAQRICEAIAGGSALTTACEAEGITRPTFYDWCDLDETLSAAYARARERQNEGVDDELRKLAADTDNTNARANETKFRILTWIAGKRSARKFGDRLELAGSKDAPLKVEVEVIGGSE